MQKSWNSDKSESCSERLTRKTTLVIPREDCPNLSLFIIFAVIFWHLVLCLFGCMFTISLIHFFVCCLVHSLYYCYSPFALVFCCSFFHPYCCCFCLLVITTYPLLHTIRKTIFLPVCYDFVAIDCLLRFYDCHFHYYNHYYYCTL